MSKGKITNCGDCAYVLKENTGMWCPFHDQPVATDLVCDDFLDALDSPQMCGLIDSVGGAEENQKTVYFRDYLAYLLTLVLVLCSVAIYMLL